MPFWSYSHHVLHFFEDVCAGAFAAVTAVLCCLALWSIFGGPWSMAIAFVIGLLILGFGYRAGPLNAILLVVALGYSAHAGRIPHGSASVIPTADVACNITTGNCTGTGGGSALFTAATCNGVADDAPAFRSFNTWAVSTWQASHTGLIELDIPSGKTCDFISGDGSSNAWMAGVISSQTVGYGATINDNAGTGGGFLLGCGRCGVQFNGTTSTVRIATVSAGSSSITLLDTAKCSLLSNGSRILIAGVDTQGFGDPPNPDRFEWPTILSTASCAGSGVVTLTAPLTYSYESTWPLYNAGDAFHSDQGGPATVYQLGGVWASTHAYYGLTIDQQANHTTAPGMDVTFRDVSCPHGFCIIPSQNLTWRAISVSAPNSDSEFDKIVSNVVMQSVTWSLITIQSAEVMNWTCTNCTVTTGVSGTVKTTTLVNSNLGSLQIGSGCCGASGAFSAANTVISGLTVTGAQADNISTRGVWSGATLTVPPNMSISSAANNGSGLIRLTVASSAGWTTGITGDGPGNTSCAGTFAVTVIDATHVDLQGSTFTATCTGTFGSLPFGWAVPGANVYFNGGSHGYPVGPVLQVADLSIGANSATVVSFNKNGSPLAGGLPTMPGGPPFTIRAHPAPSWSCTGCSGAINVSDVTGVPTGPFGSQATRVVTAANSGNATAMPAFGPLSELDMTVTAACGGASNVGFEQTMFTAVLGSASFGSWNPTANALVSSATPRAISPTTASGGQTGDSLVTPGTGTILLSGQALPFYSTAANCGSASTTVTVKTNQGVVYP